MATPHSDIELQAVRRHFFGGIATNCLNNSKSAPLSPSSAPLRTASSSPLIAVLALPLARKRCCRGDQNRRADFGSHVNSLTAHCIFRYFGDEVGKTIEGGGGSLQTVAREILSPAPLNQLLHSLLAFSALNWREISVMPLQ